MKQYFIYSVLKSSRGKLQESEIKILV